MKNNIALIIGYGSIGRKHHLLLKKLNIFKKIFILTKQKKVNKNFINDINDISVIKPSYVVISSRTSLHYSHLKILEKKIKNSKILVEKPLFDKFYSFKILKNRIFVGYNLRFHPVLIYLKKFLKNKKIFSTEVVCKSFLPDWRRNIDYRQSNSAKKSSGGGALLELSHEIDYLQWIFGKIKKLDFSELRKISNLKIDCEDSAIIVGKTSSVNFLLNLDFCSLKPERSLNIQGNKLNIKADLLKYRIEITEGKKNRIIRFPKKKNQTYNDMHKAILKKKYNNLSTFSNASMVMKIIDRIKKKREKMKIIAFIFARGGSKGIKNKNLLKFKRTTLLGHAINQARQIKDVKKVFLSTDDKVLAKYGKKHKAEVPFLRPKNLAKDNSPEIDSWRHAIKYLKDKLKLKPDYIISVPTTCPLRKISDLNLGIKLAKRKKLDILFSVTKASRSPYFNIIIKKGNKINLVSKFLKKQNKKTISRRQDGPKCFDLTTACYVFKPDYVMRTKDLFSGKVDLIEIPKERGIDIDNIYDYRLIKLLNKNV